MRASLGVLGRRWSLLILRNIGLYRRQRFGEMLEITTGLSRRMLSTRLRELKREGFIETEATNDRFLRGSPRPS